MQERQPDPRRVPRDERDDALAHELERRQRRAARVFGQAEQRQQGLERRYGDQRGPLILGRRHEAQRRRRDDAERAFATDQKIAQVVAGVVLLERLKPVPDRSVRHHRFDAEHLAARGPIRQHPQHRPRWWRDCRRWCSFLPKPC